MRKRETRHWKEQKLLQTVMSSSFRHDTPAKEVRIMVPEREEGFKHVDPKRQRGFKK